MQAIHREKWLKTIKQAIQNYPVTALIGPRQVGKTTLAHEIEKSYNGETHYLDLEYPADWNAMQNPQLCLEPLNGLIIIDEIQHKPDLFPLLRVLADRKTDSRFLILGSASSAIINQSSESLAGRIHYLEIQGFDLQEIPNDNRNVLWLRGGFPRSFLVDDATSFKWRESFLSTFIERDIPASDIRIPRMQLWRLIHMAAHYHGQVLNYSEMGRSLDMADKTVKHYIDFLTGCFLFRQLPPWFENLGKRLIKSPKFYVRDTGILHTLLGIQSLDALQKHPKVGFSWEGFCLEHILRSVRSPALDAYFWSTTSHAELDLLLTYPQRIGFEFKYSDAPQKTKSMVVAKNDLKLDQLYVVYPGKASYQLDLGITAIPLDNINAMF